MNELINPTISSLMIYSLFNIGVYVGLWKNVAQDYSELRMREHLLIANEQFPYVISDKLNQAIIIGLSALPIIKVGLESLVNNIKI